MAVLGAEYPNKKGPSRRFEIQMCSPGDPVELRREPKNPADSRAVAVYSERGIQLGYIPAEHAPMFTAMFARGQEIHAIFQAEDRFGAVIRVAFDGEKPVLPNPSARGPAASPNQTEGDDEWPPKVTGHWGA